MNYIRDLIYTTTRAGLTDGTGLSSGRLGWDYWHSGQPLTDGLGVARTPHSFSLAMPTDDGNVHPVLHPDMNSLQLLAGIWRQCLIVPGVEEEPVGPDAFAVTTVDAPSVSADHLVALIGHQPRDIALYLADLRARDPSLSRELLAKDFRAALIRRPELLTEPWPDAVRRRWKGREADYLPPILALVLYAELARVAQGQSGLLALAFDGRVELTSKGFLDRVEASIGPATLPGIARAIERAPFQTVALLPPDIMLANKDADAIRIWATTAASSIALTVAEHGVTSMIPRDHAQAKSLRANYAVHPQLAPEPRKGKGESIQPHRAGTYWGLNWKRNAAVRLLELAVTAREWNQRFQPGGSKLPDASAGQRTSQVAHAITAISFRWLALHSRAAALGELGKALTAEAKAEERFATWTANMITPLTIDDHLGERSGVALLDQAWTFMPKLPRPGAFGYTARAQAHLWLDDNGDDIAQYRSFHDQALYGFESAARGELAPELRDEARVPPEVVALLGREHGIEQRAARGVGHNQPRAIEMTSDPAMAKAAQDEAMRISAFSTDPMLARLLRGKELPS